MPFILDCSIAASWGLADESSALAQLAQERLKTDVAFVPRIWWYEIRNLLVVNERRKRLTQNDSATFLHLLAGFPIQIDETLDEVPIFQLARRHQLSFYDAAYLELARSRSAPLATLDNALRSAAAAEGVSLLT